MNIRQKYILKEMLEYEQLNIHALAKNLTVTARTIRNDMESINEYLSNIQVGCHIYMQNSVATITFTTLPKSEVSKAIVFDDYYSYKLSADERIAIILMELLRSTHTITIAELADMLYVSRGTINSDMLEVKKWCDENQIMLLSQKGKGFAIEAEEPVRRSLLAKLIHDFNTESKFDNSNMEFNIHKILFGNVNLAAIKKIIIEAETKFHFILSDIAYDRLVIHIALSAKSGSTPASFLSPPEYGPLETISREYQMANYIVHTLNDDLHIQMPPDAADYILQHLYGKSGYGKKVEESDELPYIQIIAENLILNVGNTIGFNFRSDLKLYDGLLKHLCVAIHRLKNKQSFHNPIKKELMSKYHFLFDALKQNVYRLQRFVDTKISDDELSYIVIYFATAIERERRINRNRKPSVLLVCSTGAGTAQLLTEHLKQYFNFKIIDVIPAHQLMNSIETKNIDFIISTVPLKDSLPYVLVNPLMQEEDVDTIYKTVLNLGFHSPEILTISAHGQTAENKESFANQLLSLVQSFSEPDCEERLVQKVAELLQAKARQKNCAKGVSPNMLSDLLKKEYITLNAQVENWQEAVRCGGKPLLTHHIIEEEYIDAMVRNVTEIGPYIVLTKGVALPHANNTYGVKETAISLTTLKTPVCFGNTDNDPVKYVFTLATVNADAHLVALKDLVVLFENQAFFDAIDSARDPAEIIDFILGYEKAKQEGGK